MSEPPDFETPQRSREPGWSDVRERLRALRTAPQGWLPDADADADADAGLPPHRRWVNQPRPALVVAAVCLAAVLGALALFWSGRPQWQDLPAPRPAVEVPGTPLVAVAGPIMASAATPPPVTPPLPTMVVVHVAGQVRSPGIVRLAAGSRVADAVELAGGATGKADLSTVNLARLVADGEQVLVPQRGAAAAGKVAAPGPPPAATGGVGVGPVNLNSADVATLDSLPGVGPVLAARIIEFRTQNGPFSSVEDLDDVSGIGPKVFAALRDLVVV